ncbi:MAG: GNAT family N-acetyltransferase [Acidimicrobiales bacterium]
MAPSRPRPGLTRILEVAPSGTHGLRRTVLRDGRDDEVVFAGDDERDTFHLGAVDEDGTMVGIVTFLERECPNRPDVHPARQLRGMAVAADRQGQGLGTALLRAGIERCRAEGVAVVWAHARLPAVPWYEAHGLPAEGDVYVFGVMGLPHRLVVTHLVDHIGIPP